MAKFLNTPGVSYHLEELLKATKEKLILISPYLQLSERIREHIKNLNIQKRDIQIIFRENNLQPEESNWLAGQSGVYTRLCKNLHAKCYLNESEAIITSMNLYQFSQQNNNEMGIFITKAGDPDLYTAAFEEAQRLIRISEPNKLIVKSANVANSFNPPAANHKINVAGPKQGAKLNGYCIRTGVPIPFNVDKPMSPDAFKSWSKFEDIHYPEKFCHFSGEQSRGETSFDKPVLKHYWKKAKDIHDF